MLNSLYPDRPEHQDPLAGRDDIQTDAPNRKLWSVAVYLVDSCDGGPEEGGWTYDVGEPSREHEQFTRLFRTEEQAQSYRDRLERHLIAKLNQGRRPISSVLSTGVYRACYDEGLPAPFPKTRPRYE